MIIKLPLEISRLIAAGEIVESPASVVKELVENSIDASASEISVEIADAGKSLIRVSDNGTGVDEEDIPLLLEESSTSKIKNIDDVYNVASLGFRGEALSSISEVSKVEIINKTKDMEFAQKLKYSERKLLSKEEIAGNTGFKISITEIFYNTPVRFKFLSSDLIEKNKILTILSKIALSHPEISFSLKDISINKEIFRTNGNGSLLDAIYSIYGAEVSKNLIKLDYSLNNLKLKGYISSPCYTRGNSNYTSLFVNGRYLESRKFSNIIKKAYDGLLMHRRHPVYVLNLEIENSSVDVNVHPQKKHVKFENEELVENILYYGVRNTVLKKPSYEKEEATISDKKLLISENCAKINIDKTETYLEEEIEKTEEKEEEIKEKKLKNQIDFSSSSDDFEEEKNIENYLEEFNTKNESSKACDSKEYSFQNEKHSDITDSQLSFQKNYLEGLLNSKNKDNSTVSDKKTKPNVFLKYKILAQAFLTYIILEYDGELAFVDQHAAHERILYEKFSNEFKNSKYSFQKLLSPVEYEINKTDAYILEKGCDYFKELGLDIEISSNKILVHSLPMLKNQIKPIEMINLIDLYVKHGKESFEESFKDKIIMASCKAAIKSGDKLSIIEMRALLDDLAACENPNTCPHGRPIVNKLTRSYFDKLFRRELWEMFM